jgi:hypothetical protein
MSADDSGRCVCNDPSPFACATQLLGLLCVAVVAITTATGYVCFLGGTALSVGDDRLLSTQSQALRKRLGLRKRDGYLLSSERISLWHSQSMFTIISADHFDAAVRLDCLRDDFDPKHVDALCLALHDMPCSARIGSWLLDLCSLLLDPAVVSQPSCSLRLGRRGSTGSSWLSAAFIGQDIDGDSVGKNMFRWLLTEPQEIRLAYFFERIAGFQIFLVDNKALFKLLKGVVDAHMVQVGGLCTARFMQLVSEEGGQCLMSLRTLAEFDGTNSSARYSSFVARGSYSAFRENTRDTSKGHKSVGLLSQPTLELECSV